VVLAKMLGYNFIDSDLLIQAREGKLLRNIIKDEGREVFNRIENDVNASIVTNHTVIATGGSVIYGTKAMEHLKSIGRVVYIKLPISEITGRLGNISGRGISMGDGQTVFDLYTERAPLYERYADIIFCTARYSISEAAEYIINLIK
jgi:shikimate kinase